MKMNIEYPAMVEQGFEAMRAMGMGVTKDQVYKRMVEGGMIDQTGQPTQAAINAGLFEKVEPQKDERYRTMTLAQFKREYPEYQQFADSHFVESERGWAVDAYVVRALANQRLSEPDITDAQRQNAYLMLQQADEMEGNK